MKSDEITEVNGEQERERERGKSMGGKNSDSKHTIKETKAARHLIVNQFISNR